MAIKDKHGNILKIHGQPQISPEVQVNLPKEEPVKKEENWDKSQVSLENFEFPEEIVPDTKREQEPVILQKEPIPDTKREQEPVILPKEPVLADQIIYIENDKEVLINGIVLEEDDLSCLFWTQYNVVSGAIIFPKNFSKRWWKINEIEAKHNGWLCLAHITVAILKLEE